MAYETTKRRLQEILEGEGRNERMDDVVRGVEFDSRRVVAGNLFVALPGEVSHGHAYLEAAFTSGASLAIVEDRELLSAPFGDRLIHCPSSLEALWTMAREYREKLSGLVLGITGSMGKTTVKELAAAMLRNAGLSVTASAKSFNNHLGVPYTLLGADTSDDCVVLEMGMNHAGELHGLSLLARPDAVTITGIAPVHVEFFPTLEAIADAKLEILDGVLSDGEAILNGDDALLLRRYGARRSQAPLTFGTGSEADCQVSDVKSRGLAGVSFGLAFGPKREAFELPVPGAHNALLTAAAALSVMTLFPDTPLATVKAAVSKFIPAPMRMNTHVLSDGRIVIDDSYNANPLAMRGALSLLGEEKESGKRIAALLGDMKELGAESDRYHDEIGGVAADLGLSALATVGEQAKRYSAKAGKGTEVGTFTTPEDAAEWLRVQGFDVLLVKASRGIGLDRAVKKLLAK